MKHKWHVTEVIKQLQAIKKIVLFRKELDEIIVPMICGKL